MHLEEATQYSEELLLGVRRLCTELAPAVPALTPERLRQILAGDACRLLVARAQDGALVGMLLLASYPIPTGRRFWIEDVAVAPEARGEGVGEALVRRALELARAAGAETVDLTCRPARAAANRLYRRIGFVQRETNVYRYHLRGREGEPG